MGEKKRDLDRNERIDWLQLIRTDTVGPITFQRLLAKYGAPSQVLEALPELSKKAGRKKPLIPPSRDQIEVELDLAERIGARPIAMVEPDYPTVLAAIPDPPPMIYGIGHTSLFEKPAVAIVGARNASAAGRKLASTFAHDLGEAGYAIVSGLARGIDGAAHTASLVNGTIAVVAGGVDVIYPPEHRELMQEIGRRGLILSERPPGAQPTARDFPRRNRLISGLSRGVVVVEAAVRSGTLITARTAAEQGREVFAVPGSPLDPRCKGSNNLIRDGACLAESADDIITNLASQLGGVGEKEQPTFNFEDQFAGKETIAMDQERQEKNKETVRELLSPTPIHRDEIIRASGLGAGEVADALLDLVLSGEALEEFGGFFAFSAE